MKSKDTSKTDKQKEEDFKNQKLLDKAKKIEDAEKLKPVIWRKIQIPPTSKPDAS